MPPANRWMATLRSPQTSPTVRHHVGLPPELGGNPSRHELTGTAHLLVEQTSEGYSLLRFTSQGHYLTDTWHMTLEDAKHQASFEFPGIPIEWRKVPPDEVDPIPFGLKGS